MRLTSESLCSPSAVIGIVVAILLLLALDVIALRTGGAEQEAEPEARVATEAASEAASDASTPEVQGSGVPGGDGPLASPRPTDSPTPGETPTPATDRSLSAGTCVRDDGRSSDVTSVEVIDCAIEHTGEVFAATPVARPADAAYPGADVLENELRMLCQGSAFEEYVGTPYANSGLFAYALLPTEETWAAGDRDVACILYAVTGPLVGSQRGSGR